MPIDRKITYLGSAILWRFGPASDTIEKTRRFFIRHTVIHIDRNRNSAKKFAVSSGILSKKNFRKWILRFIAVFFRQNDFALISIDLKSGYRRIFATDIFRDFFRDLLLGFDFGFEKFDQR